MRSFVATLVILSVFFANDIVLAQGPLPYGSPISLSVAKKLMAAAEAEAEKQSWPVAIAIVDSGGHLVMLHRRENTQLGSIEICQQKAKTAVMFRRPSKVFQDLVAQGGINLKLLRLSGIPFDGGLPIVHDGKIIGGIGVSGVRSDQDAVVGKAGLAALKPK
jgi:uncharacterized protein GlcG (DUF336 family)